MTDQIRLNCLTRTHGKGDPCPYCETQEVVGVEIGTMANRVIVVEKKPVEPIMVMETLRLQLEALTLGGSQAQRRMELTMAREIPCDLWMSYGM